MKLKFTIRISTHALPFGMCVLFARLRPSMFRKTCIFSSLKTRTCPCAYQFRWLFVEIFPVVEWHLAQCLPCHMHKFQLREQDSGRKWMMDGSCDFRQSETFCSFVKFYIFTPCPVALLGNPWCTWLPYIMNSLGADYRISPVMKNTWK